MRADKIRHYRPCAGAIVINKQGLVWTGLRIGAALHQPLWQFPQGGIDKNETPKQACLRELAEETGITQTSLIYELPYWLSYDLPPEAIGIALKGKYKGQKQKWFALRFEGNDSDIDISGHKKPEFEAWAWRRMGDCPSIVVPFKRALYQQLVKDFAGFYA